MTETHAVIRRLPENVIRAIAAGEVIERPSSVLKELLENSLDAGATRVSVDVEGGVDRFLRISDDGCGMSEADLKLSLERHATSKIESAEDLWRIDSLGFRGEGLSSIAAVSRMTIVTSTEDGGGTRAIVEAGNIVEIGAEGRARGTTIEVRDIFFNTPARRKFQRAASTELQHVARTLQSYALARGDVHFRYGVDGREILNLPPAPLADRMAAIFGRDRVRRMIAVEARTPLVRLEGYLGAPEDQRARSDQQTFFINGRWSTNPLLRQAVRQAYGNLIPFDRHPFVVLSVHVDPGRVDVNVHPTKREVRFSSDRDLFPALVSSLKKIVIAHQPAWEGRMGGRDADPAGHRDAVRDMGDLFAPASNDASGVREEAPPSNILPFSGLDALPGSGGASAQETLIEEPARADLWQLHRTYIMASIRNGVMIIDQHAAHERVLFEEAILRLRAGRGTAQQLLFPRVVELTPEEFQKLLDIQVTLDRLGFHIELFGGTTVLVHGIPAGLTRWKDGELLHEMIALYGDLPGGPPIEERVARSYACRAAVKAGEPLTALEMNELVDRLFATTLPQGDPHGRPTYLRIPIEELHRRFGRSG